MGAHVAFKILLGMHLETQPEWIELKGRAILDLCGYLTPLAPKEPNRRWYQPFWPIEEEWASASTVRHRAKKQKTPGWKHSFWTADTGRDGLYTLELFCHTGKPMSIIRQCRY